MFKKQRLCILIMVPFLSESHTHGCAIVGASMETTLFKAVSRDLQIDTSTILRSKTLVEIIDISSVSKIYATSLAKLDYQNAMTNGKATIPENDYYNSYYENHTQSLTAKYTYTNKSMQRDIFIASSLINKDECSVRFNGYITLLREF